MISLVTLAPGAVGLGITGGSPGSGVDNFSTETQVDVSANGQGGVGNMYVVDGLDVTSSIRPGVLNLTPDPDSVQEASIETNTFNVDYGRASSIEMLMTTKSGTDQFHGSASDYFTNQKFFAGTEFVHSYSPFHSNNMSGTIGGPVIPHHQLFFFFSIEPLRSSASTGNSTTTFEDPAFTAWAQQNYPNTLGTKLLTTYKPSGATVTGVSQTAQQIFPGTCGTPATNNLPCTLPMVDNGVFNSSNFRNGTQWNLRIDKYFKNDRIYGNFYRTTLNYGGGALRPQFITTNNTYQRALQINETHTFSATTLNEAVFGVNRIEGLQPNTGLFSVPLVNVTGVGTGFGSGFAHGDFIQHNYHWRDVLTNIRGAHTLRFGYEGWFGDDVEEFQGPHAQPTFQFNNLLNLVQDQPYNESGVSYNPLTGQFVPWDWNAASKTWGLFAEDTWKVGKTLTLNYGVRYDDYGNPYSRDPNTVFGNFFYGPGQTTNQQIANGIVVSSKNALSHSVDTIFSPRGGFAWNIKGNNAGCCAAALASSIIGQPMRMSKEFGVTRQGRFTQRFLAEPQPRRCSPSALAILIRSGTLTRPFPPDSSTRTAASWAKRSPSELSIQTCCLLSPTSLRQRLSEGSAIMWWPAWGIQAAADDLLSGGNQVTAVATAWISMVFQGT